MNYKKYLIVASILLIILGGCSNKDAEFDSLVEQANRHYNGEEYISSAAVYSKALEVKEDPDIRSKLTEVNTEIKRIEEVILLIDEFRSIASKYESVRTPQDIFDTCAAYLDIFAKIDSFDTTPSDPATKYIESIRDSREYLFIKTESAIIQTYYLVGKRVDGPYKDAKAISDKVTELFDAYPLPDGFVVQ
ncbi:hypothetical protein [Paenibacillus faecalis]|uniref:hypothetical protein n=1 Tax=Paenibacillus faecalis TaxID=2079532 RepID=UPI000D101A43|nr:hypothetical protein [Paenibacillus faecalis]